MNTGSNQRVYDFGQFRLDAERLMLYEDGQEVQLPPKCVKTLLVLVERAGEIVGKSELIDAVWPETIVEESNLSQNLYLLRRTLGQIPDGRPFIETLRRRGYRFNGSLSQTEPISSDRSRKRQQIPLNVERRGNILSVAEWPQPTAVGDIPELRLSPEPAGPAARVPRLIGIAVILVAIVLVSAAAVMYFTKGSRPATKAVGTNGFSIIRLTNGSEVRNATISSDGRYFVYDERDESVSRMWIQQTGVSSRVELIPPTQNEIQSKTFSPDGEFVYFVLADLATGNTALYRVPTLGGPVSKIADNVRNNVSFSADGREMAFLRHDRENREGQYVLIPMDGTGQERIAHAWKNDTLRNTGPALSPDGKTIVFGSPDDESLLSGCSLHLIDTDSGLVSSLAGNWDQCYRIQWRPDGRGIYLIGTRAGDSMSIRRDQLYYVSLPDGRAERITNDENRHQENSLGVTQDGAILTVPYNRASQIWRMGADGDTRSAVQITAGLADGRAGLAPLADGRLAFITRTGENLAIWTVNADGSDKKQITVDPPYLEELRSSAGSPYLVYAAGDRREYHLYRIGPDGSDRTQLTFGATQEIDSSISSDGNWIVFDRVAANVPGERESLWKMPFGGGEAVRIEDGDCSVPHFSPDNQMISCVEDQKIIHLISAATGKRIRTIPALRNSVLNFGPRWTPDGKSVASVVNVAGVSNIWLQPIDGGTARPLTNFSAGSIYNFVFSLDGTHLFVARGQQVRDVILMRPNN